MTALKVSADVMNVLDAATIDGSLLTLNGQLDRKLYVATNAVLEAAGGKWSKKLRGHVFDGDAMDTIEPIILTGEYRRTKQDFGQFDTPESLAADIIEMAGIRPGIWVLEPSAGTGSLAFKAAERGARVMCYEIDKKRCEALVKASAGAANHLDMVVQHDFLTTRAAPNYHRVVMNPPFAKQDDIRHVLHALPFLLPGGRLVAIMSAGAMHRENRMAVEFREFVARHGGTLTKLPEGSFRSSGTDVQSCVLVLDAPEVPA